MSKEYKVRITVPTYIFVTYDVTVTADDADDAIDKAFDVQLAEDRLPYRATDGSIASRNGTKLAGGDRDNMDYDEADAEVVDE